MSDPTPVEPPPLVRVVLPGIPVQPLLATDAFQRSVLREFDLMFVASAGGSGRDKPGAEILVVRRLLQMYEAAYAGVIAACEAAAEAEQRTVDLEFELPREAADAARVYVQLMEEVDEDARKMRLLTPPDPEVTRFRRWFAELVISKLEDDGQQH